MADMCIYESQYGDEPNCEMRCNESCPYYYVDEALRIIKQWKDEAHVDTPIVIKYDSKKQCMNIYTTKPGYLIGRCGERYYKYRNMLTEAIKRRFTIGYNGEEIDMDKHIKIIECDDAVK